MDPLSYAEDIVIGVPLPLGEYVMATDEVEEFRDRWDLGLTRASARRRGSDGAEPPIASGIHSLAVLQRLASLAVLQGWAVVAGRRLREVVFDAPVRAGMVLSGELIVDGIASRSSRSALIVFTGTLRHEGESVLRATHEAVILRRPAPPLDPPGGSETDRSH